MLMGNPLVQSPGWWSLPKKKRFEMASSQSMINPFPRERKILPMPYSYSHGSVDPGLNAANARVASGTTIPQTKKKSNKLKYIVEALKEMEGAEPPKLSGGKFGRAMPAPLGFSLASMGGRLGEQEAMAKARREEELRRRMKLMGGGY